MYQLNDFFYPIEGTTKRFINCDHGVFTQT